MSAIPRPDTTEEMTEQLWYAIIGSNGDGLATSIKRTEKEVAALKAIIPTLMTKAECSRQEESKEKKIERRKLRPVDKITISLAALSAIFFGIQAIAMLAPLFKGVVP